MLLLLALLRLFHSPTVVVRCFRTKTRGLKMTVSDAGRVVLQIHAEIACDFARSSVAHEGSMANQIHGSPVYVDVALHVHMR